MAHKTKASGEKLPISDFQKVEKRMKILSWVCCGATSIVLLCYCLFSKQVLEYATVIEQTNANARNQINSMSALWYTIVSVYAILPIAIINLFVGDSILQLEKIKEKRRYLARFLELLVLDMIMIIVPLLAALFHDDALWMRGLVFCGFALFVLSLIVPFIKAPDINLNHKVLHWLQNSFLSIGTVESLIFILVGPFVINF